jgi:hypothetical protein
MIKGEGSGEGFLRIAVAEDFTLHISKTVLSESFIFFKFSFIGF